MDKHTHTHIEAPATTQTIITPVAPTPQPRDATLRTVEYRPPRRRFPGVLAACVLGAGIGALAVSSFYDERSVGERLDATVNATHQTVQQGVDNLRDGAANAARDGAHVGDRAASALNDAGITAAVKTALAADPRLSAVKIDVDTKAGVVTLNGPAPDAKSRERAEVLAGAPDGVQRVENHLVVSAPADPAVSSQ